MRKPAFCICENKDANQLRGNREVDQRLCYRYMDSTIPLLPEYEISSLLPSSVAVQPGLCRTWSETPKTGFLTMRLRYYRRESTRGETTKWSEATSGVKRLRGNDLGAKRLGNQGFFSGVSGAVIRPLSQWQIPTFFLNLDQKIPNQKVFLCK